MMVGTATKMKLIQPDHNTSFDTFCYFNYLLILLLHAVTKTKTVQTPSGISKKFSFFHHEIITHFSLSIRRHHFMNLLSKFYVFRTHITLIRDSKYPASSNHLTFTKVLHNSASVFKSRRSTS